MARLLAALTVTVLLAAGAAAHDTWVQTNTNVVRPGDVVHVALLLGNHGNAHRDFKLAGKVDLAPSTLTLIAPNGKSLDVKEHLADLGYAPTEGFWSAPLANKEPGLYLVAHTYEKVMSYAPVRAVRSAKTYFLVSPSLDRPEDKQRDYARVLGHPLELVPDAHPVVPMGPGLPIKVRLLYQGKPLANERVSFIPRGETLVEGFDKRYERLTDAEGRARFEPSAGNVYLIVAHKEDPTASGKDYQRTKYSATLTVFVPQICPCCAE